MSRTKTVTFRVRVDLLAEFKQAVAAVKRHMKTGDGEAFQSAMLAFARSELDGKLDAIGRFRACDIEAARKALKVGGKAGDQAIVDAMKPLAEDLRRSEQGSRRKHG